jgi:nitrite reductase/ring-hydroxylating ferredoxin subunit
MGELIRVAGTAEIAAGSGIVVEVKGQAIAVFNVTGAFHAIDNTCVHRGGPLGEGELEGNVVTCPWHSWQYDVTTGMCKNSPAAKVKSYPVQVQGTDILVEF